jgi:hypothetical protein
MRLSTDQVQAIRQTAQRVLGEGVRVRVFGSQVQNENKGGDIVCSLRQTLRLTTGPMYFVSCTVH